MTDKRRKQLKAYARVLISAIGLCAAIYWLVTGEKPPGYRDVLRDYS